MFILRQNFGKEKNTFNLIHLSMTMIHWLKTSRSAVVLELVTKGNKILNCKVNLKSPESESET